MTTGPKRRPKRTPGSRPVPPRSAQTPPGDEQLALDSQPKPETPDPTPANLLAAQIAFYHTLTATAKLAGDLIRMAIEEGKD